MTTETKKEDGPLELTLTTPITGPDGKEIKKLVFREPTAGDIAAVGFPVQIGLAPTGEKLIIDGPTMFAMIAHLCGVPAPLLSPMKASDFGTAQQKISPFFTT